MSISTLPLPEKACLKLESSRHTVTGFFTPVIESVRQIMEQNLMAMTQVVLVPGGFGSSLHLLDELKQYCKPRNIHVVGSTQYL